MKQQQTKQNKKTHEHTFCVSAESKDLCCNRQVPSTYASANYKLESNQTVKYYQFQLYQEQTNFDSSMHLQAGKKNNRHEKN